MDMDGSSPHQVTTIQFAHEVESIGQIRRWVRSQLGDLDDLTVDAALLLVSELATNAVRHCSGSRLDVTVDRGESIRVGVADACPHSVSPRDPAPTDTGGRGLMLVDRLAAIWGVHLDDEGKDIWFELPIASPFEG
jgi:anti-sigma regulatory factor (Ser/Thr protein kinase)